MADNGRGRKKRVAVLISGRGSNMAALIEAAKAPRFPAEIALVLSNRPDAAGLAHARAAGIAAAVVDHAAQGKDREAFERAMQAVLEKNRIDLVCLAGFMRLLTPWFVGRWDRPHAQHPPGAAARLQRPRHARARARRRGENPWRKRAFRRARDGFGPIIAQGAVPVRDDDTPATLAARVLEVEHRIYPLALGLVAAERVRIVGDRCVIDAAYGSRKES